MYSIRCMCLHWPVSTRPLMIAQALKKVHKKCSERRVIIYGNLSDHKNVCILFDCSNAGSLIYRLRSVIDFERQLKSHYFILAFFSLELIYFV